MFTRSTSALLCVVALCHVGIAWSAPGRDKQRTYAIPQQSQADHVTSRVQEEAISGEGLGITETGVLRKPQPYAFSLIEDFEAWIPKPYDDASRYCTIGYGHLIAKSPCASARDQVMRFANPLGKKDGEILLDNDTALASKSISKWVQINLNDQQFGALVSFVFNVGSDNFSRSSMLQYVNSGNFEAAARQFGRWVKSKNKVLDGLVSRRACEAALFTGKIPVGNVSTFSRSSCSSLGAAPDSGDLIDVEIGEK